MHEKVFISYCHESVEHSKNVLELADKLNNFGIDCNIDQYELDVPQGWPMWMNEQIDIANFVLIICTEKYYASCSSVTKNSNISKGVKFESLLSYQYLYENSSYNTKFIPVILKKEDLSFIPNPLKSFSYYLIDSEDGFVNLYRRLTNQPKIIKPKTKDINLLQVGENLLFNKPESEFENSISEKRLNDNKIRIELTIDRDFDSYSETEIEQLLKVVKDALLINGDVSIISKRKGSLLLTVELEYDDCKKLYKAIKAGEFRKLHIIDAEIIPQKKAPIANKPKTKSLSKQIKILVISQDFSPFTDDSEIGTISLKLSQAIQENGKMVRTIVPKYGSINERKNQLHEVVRLGGNYVNVDGDQKPLILKVASLPAARLQIYFIDNDEFFERKYKFRDANNVFFKDNDERILFFCKGALETLKKLNWSPDIIHCHGWITSLIPLLVKTSYKDDPLFSDTKVIYSLYNDGFHESLNFDYINKLAMDGIAQSDLLSLKNPSFENISINAISKSDAVVIGNNNVNLKILNYLNTSDIPVLQYQADRNFIDANVNFYDVVFNNSDSLIDDFITVDL